MENTVLNYIWFGMIFLGVIVGIMNGRLDEVTKAAIDSAKTAIMLSIELMGVMCLWTGMMGIAEKSGLVRAIARSVKPVMRFLFPEVPKNHPAMGAMVMNMVANFFGLGNAATPFGLKAIGELQKLNLVKDTATNSMCMFLVLNTASIQLVPATVIAIRSAENSANPTEIMGTIWIASACAAVTGIIAAKLLENIKKR